MQELHADKDFFDWLRTVSREYGEAMTDWGQHVHDAVADGGVIGVQRLLTATDAAVERLVDALMVIGRQHDAPGTPKGGAAVLDALDRLLGASADLLRDARAGLEEQGLPAIATLSPRVTELRGLEADVEQQTEGMRGRLESTFGDPGKP